MLIPLKFVELPSPLFLNGVNMQTKLDIKRRPLKLTYDRKNKELHIVHFNGDKASAMIIPSFGVYMEPIDPKAAGIDMDIIKVEQISPPQVGQPNAKIKAQVSTPMDQVQGGPGIRRGATGPK